MRGLTIVLAVCLAGHVEMAAAEEPALEAQFIYPPENIHNHSSSIVECPNGDLLACWYHGHGERTADDVVVQGARKAKGAREWSERFLMADTPGLPDCNPILFVTPDQKLWLIWVAIINNEWGSALLRIRFSEDFTGPGEPRWKWQDNIILKPDDFDRHIKEGAARFKLLRATSKRVDEYFTQMEKASTDKLTVRSGWMPRTHPLALPDGRILVGLYSDVFSVSMMAITQDGGKTWKASRPLIGGGNVQPSVVRKKDGSLVAMHRENGISHRIRLCESKDGLIWGEVTNSELPNPGSSVEVIATTSGNWVLAYNDTTKGRHSLAVSLSEDEGKTWKHTRHLEKDEEGKGSYSYPSLIQSKDGRLHCTYSFSKGGECIKYTCFSEDWIKSGDPAKQQ